MQADRDAALSWRETFDELLVFEQDFDTAMQILMFQDEKVARLSLEDSQHTRSQRTRSRQEASIRGTKAGSAGDRAGSSVDVLGVGRGDGTGTGLVASLFSTGSGKRVSISKAKLDTYEKQMCDDDSDVLAPSSARTDGHSKQLSSGTKAGSAGDRAGSSVDVLGVGRGDGTGTGLVASLFSTGSGKRVSISKAKLDAYERQMCDDDSNVLAPSSARTDGHSKQLSSGTKAGSAGDRAGSSVDVLGVGRGDGTGTGLVASLFSTGSGKRVSISKAKLDAYERQMCDDDSNVLAPSSARTDGHSKQLSSGTKAGSAGDRAGSSVDVLGVGRGDGTGTGLVASLFSTGSGKRVSISKAKLDTYEKQMCDDDSDVLAPSSARTDGHSKQLSSGTKAGSAGDRAGSSVDVLGVGRGDGTGTGLVASLFSTGSGKRVSISKAKLDAYERQMCDDDSDVLAPSSARTDGHSKQLSSGTKAGSAGDRAGSSVDVLGVGRGDGTGTGLVASLFSTGSGKRVSISKAKLDAYERQMCDDDSDVLAPSSARTDGHSKQLSSGTKAGSAGDRAGSSVDVLGVGRGDGTGTGLVASLFSTGSGKRVSISKAKLDAYERQMCDDDSNVLAPSSARTDGHSKQLSSGTKAGSAGDRAGSSVDVLGVGRGDGTGTGLVASLFSTGSGKRVSISKAKLDTYEKQMCDDDSDVLAPSSARTDGHSKQLSSGTKAGSAGDRAGSSVDVLGVGRGDGTGTGLVASLFSTGSGKRVSISKAKLDAYERQMCDDDSDVLAPLITLTEGDALKLGAEVKGDHSENTTSSRDLSSIVNRSRDTAVPIEREVEQGVESVVGYLANKSATLMRGSGKMVVISAPRPHTCEGESGAGSGIECNGSCTNMVQRIATEVIVEDVSEGASTSRRLEKTGLAERKVCGERGDPRDRMVRQSTPSNELTLPCRNRGTAVPSYRLSDSAYPVTETRHHQGQRLDCGDKENVHPENVLDRKTAAPEASKTRRMSVSSVHLNSRQALNQGSRQQKRMKRALKPSIEPCSKLVGKKRFHPPVASKRLCTSNSKSYQDIDHSTAPRSKKQKVADTEVRPFIYQESMKISLTTLIGLHDDHSLGGACELPRLQVLNSITAENAIKMCFGRDGSLILSSDESYDRALFIGPRELYGQLRAGNHIVKKTGATFVWFLNHYRWIVWKLAAMERVFPRLLLAKYLTKDQVLKQMSHRYQRDVNDAQRSIVKKILQRDASSLSCMVLCIAAVLPSNSAVDQELPACWNMALVLTDGWYSVYAVPDAPLAAVLWKLHAKSSLVGTKFATWNASLQNSTEGIDPLDCAIVRESEWRNPLMADDDQTQWPYLQLRYNSTRRLRGRWRMVRSVRVRVARISPVLHLQSKEWTLGPRILCEEQLPLYFQLRSEYAQAVMRKKHRHDDRADDWSSDDQIDVPLPIPFIKVDVECTHSSSNEDQGIGCGILTIWRPSEDLLSGGLREGVEYFASSLTVNWKLDGGRGQDAFLRLSSTKHSCFEEMHEESLANNETKDTWQTQRQRVCVDVQQGTMDYRANFEDGVNGRRNERRPKIDVCVCVVLVAARETQDASSSSTKKQVEVSLLDPAIKPQESRYFEHVFVTDQSCHLMSIRVSGMEVSMSKKKSNSPLKRSSSSSFIFRRGTKNIWKEGAILCLSGLEVSHYDEQLRVLDCVLVESTQIVSYPSKRSPFWDRFQLLQREAGISTTRNTGSQILPTSTNFAKEFTQLKKYVERDILRMDFVPSQECSEHHVEVVEQERLTQDLQAHEEGGEHATVEGVDELTKTPNHLCWDARVVKIMPLVGSNMFMFPRDVVAFACVNMGTDDTAFRTVYLTREIILSMQALLQEAGAPDGATGTNTAFVQSITDKLKEQNSDHSFRFEVRQSTNERLINSWKPWERLHASYWMAVSVAAIPTVK
ncbi:Breast cancer type 2 susceptibility protein [Phytophthora cactorum]|nr:Breast cancer type 2 susceptibility protein [Phytophthora cactorum]